MRRTILFSVVMGLVLLAIFSFFAKDKISQNLWERFGLFYIPTVVTSDVGLLHGIGSHYFSGDHYSLPRATRAYEEILDINEDDFLAHYNLSRIYLARGDLGRSITHATKAHEVVPSEPSPYYIRGLALAYAGQLENAERDFRIFLSSAPNAWGAYNDLSWVLLQREKYEDALNVALEGLDKADAENPWLLNNAGVAAMNLGMYTGAISYFEEALLFAEALSDDEWYQAYTANAQGAVPLIRSDFLVSLLVNMATVHEERGDIKNADIFYERASQYVYSGHYLEDVLNSKINVDN